MPSPNLTLCTVNGNAHRTDVQRFPRPGGVLSIYDTTLQRRALMPGLAELAGGSAVSNVPPNHIPAFKRLRAALVTTPKESALRHHVAA